MAGRCMPWLTKAGGSDQPPRGTAHVGAGTVWLFGHGSRLYGQVYVVDADDTISAQTKAMARLTGNRKLLRGVSFLPLWRFLIT